MQRDTSLNKWTGRQGLKEKRLHCGHAPQGLGMAETLHSEGNLTDERALRKLK